MPLAIKLSFRQMTPRAGKSNQILDRIGNEVTVVVGLGLVLVLGIFLFSCSSQEVERKVTPTKTTNVTFTPSLQEKVGDDSTIESIPTLALLPEGSSSNNVSDALPSSPSPLENIEFPTSEVKYPSDYPAELRYPAEFTPVEIKSGTLPGTDDVGWSVSLRYKGNTKAAASRLASFFQTSGWEVQRIDLDAGGYMLLVEKDSKQHTGGLIISPDTKNPEDTLILATIRF